MNIINKTFLRAALLPRAFYQKLGVNMAQLSAILAVKLTMDDRRLSSFQQTRRRKENKVSSSTIFTMLISAVFGLLYLLAFRVGSTIVTSLTLYFFMFFFLLSATLIADFTSVLIDVRDTHIILPKPVNDRTVLVARLLHILIHISKLVLPMSIPGLIYIGIGYGILAAIWLAILIFLLTLFALFFINAVYIFILRITTPQRFQQIINYFQIVFAIVIYGAYQILPRIMDTEGMQSFDIGAHNWAMYVPLYWFATSWNVLTHFDGTSLEIALTVLGFITPLLGIWIVVRFLAPSFNNKLALINSAATESNVASHKLVEHRRSTYSELLAKLFTKGNAERAGFLFTWKMMGRSRDFKLKVYPSIGYLAVYVVLMLLRSQDINMEMLRDQQGAGRIIIISALYFMAFLLITALAQIGFSEKYKAAWIFYIAPIRFPGEVISGSVKATILKFYIPVVAGLVIAGLFVAGISILPNILLGLFNQLLIATLMVYINHRFLPFARQQDNNRKGGAFLRNLGVMLISGIIAVGHYMIYGLPIVVMICAVLSIIATWFLMGSVKRTSWNDLRYGFSDD